MRIAGWGVILLAVALPAPLPAQQPSHLRYVPRQGELLRTLLGARGTIVFREIVAGQPGPDSIVGEMNRLASVTQRVLETAGPLRVLEVRYDSLRIRSRLLGQAWKENVLPDSLKGPYRVPIDEQFRWGSDGNGALEALPDWLGVQFPEEAISLGGSWTYPSVFRLPEELGQLLEIGITAPLEGSTSVTLDSIVPRSTDTLMYFTIERALGPLILPAVDAGDSAEIAVVGASAGTLIWSSGWQAFVSGASQTRVGGRLRGVGRAGMREASVTWLITTRLQVRL